MEDYKFYESAINGYCCICIKEANIWLAHRDGLCLLCKKCSKTFGYIPNHEFKLVLY